MGDVCRELTDVTGVDVVFDCVGVQPGLEAGFDVVKQTGAFVNVAVREALISMVTLGGCLMLNVVTDPAPFPPVLLQGDQRPKLLLLQ